MVYDLLKLPLLLLVLVPSFASSDDFDPIVYLNTIKTIQGEFIQRSVNASSQPMQESSGEVFIKKPNNFLWNLKTPYRKTVLIVKDTITYFDADLEQIVISDYLLENQISWVNLFLNNAEIQPTETIQTKKLMNGDTQVNFNEMQGLYTNVIFIFNSGSLKKIELLDQNSNSINIEFSKFITNQALTDDLFDYQFPPSADVIDQRQ